MKPATIFQLARQVMRHPRYMRGLLRKKLRLHQRYRWISRHAGGESRVPLPLVYKLELTRACNLRCAGCFQWGHNGRYRTEAVQYSHREMDWEIIEKLFTEVGVSRPEIILIGGEPLLYSRFAALSDLIRKYRCSTIICTNGTELDKYQQIFACNPFLSPLISLDGIAETNDMIRGHGVYATVTDNIRALKRLRRPPYMGIQITVRPQNAGHLYTFCREMANLGADWILLNLFWFVTGSEAIAYERFVLDAYDCQPSKHHGFSMPCPVIPEVFVEQFRKIMAAHLPVQVSCYLKEPDDMHAYISDAAELICDMRCHKQWIRADILPDGSVTPCIQFPDLVFGNLRDRSMREIWNNALFEEFRKRARRMNHPLCGKCDCIYLYDARRYSL